MVAVLVAELSRIADVIGINAVCHGYVIQRNVIDQSRIVNGNRIIENIVCKNPVKRGADTYIPIKIIVCN
jgi:hypothetical protein